MSNSYILLYIWLFSVPADLRDTINKCGQSHILEFLGAGKVAEKDIPDFINQVLNINYHPIVEKNRLS